LRHPQIFSPKGCSSCHQRNSIRAWSPLKKRRIAERASSIDASADPKLDKRERIELETLPDDNMILIWYNMPPKIVHILLFVFRYIKDESIRSWKGDVDDVWKRKYQES
jgi:hypothetical protein